MMQIKKAEFIMGNKLSFRNVQIDDAKFILKLRTDENKSKHLSKVSGDLSAQEQWLRTYQNCDDQAYFIIMSDGRPCGTVRMYDACGDSFCWGSWLLMDGSPSSFAIESALIVYSYALELGFLSSHFDVRKGNESVWRFHERFGAVITHQSELDIFYKIDENAILKSLKRYDKFLPHGINYSN
jgi:hypothetical protein